MRLLSDSDNLVRREALGVLGWLKAEEALPAMMYLAKDADPQIRLSVMVAMVFVRSGGPGVPTLIEGLKDGDWQVREQAAVSLGKARIPEAADALLAAASDPAWQVVCKAVNTLGKLKIERAVPTIGEKLSSPMSNVRKECAAALGEIASPAAAPYLERVGVDPDPDVRKLVQWALSRCRQAG
jgi:HEAT repeat protein